MTKTELFEAFNDINEDYITEAGKILSEKTSFLRLDLTKTLIKRFSFAALFVLTFSLLYFASSKYIGETSIDPFVETAPKTDTILTSTVLERGEEIFYSSAPLSTVSKTASSSGQSGWVSTSSGASNIIVVHSSSPKTSMVSEKLEYLWDHKAKPAKFKSFQNENREYIYPFRDAEEITVRSNREIITVNSDAVLYAYAGEVLNAANATIYTVGDFSKELLLGVKFENGDGVFPYVNHSYCPDNLGQFLSCFDYFDSVYYGGIKLYSGTVFPVNISNSEDIKNYLLKNTDALNEKDADLNSVYVAVKINFDELGKYSKEMKIYENGYISFDVLNESFNFYVGEDSVCDFLYNSYHITFADVKALG